jgi:hypothetical protein
VASRLRRAILVILIIFVIYAVINDPTQSADKTGSIWDWLKGGIDNIGTFFDTLLNS